MSRPRIRVTSIWRLSKARSVCWDRHWWSMIRAELLIDCREGWGRGGLLAPGFARSMPRIRGMRRYASSFPSRKSLIEVEFFARRFRHHVRGPRRIPYDLDVGLLAIGKAQQLVLNVLADHRTHLTSGRGQR